MTSRSTSEQKPFTAIESTSNIIRFNCVWAQNILWPIVIATTNELAACFFISFSFSLGLFSEIQREIEFIHSVKIGEKEIYKNKIYLFFLIYLSFLVACISGKHQVFLISSEFINLSSSTTEKKERKCLPFMCRFIEELLNSCSEIHILYFVKEEICVEQTTTTTKTKI